MIRLDATQSLMTDEPQRSEEQSHTPQPATPSLRCITLPLPDSCRTQVVLLLQAAEFPNAVLTMDQPTGGNTKLWFCGFRVHRDYQPGDEWDREHEELPGVSDPDNPDDGWELLGDCIAQAARAAQDWIQFNSEDDVVDPQSAAAREAIAAWLEEFDNETATETMFDDQAAEEAVAEATGSPPADSTASAADAAPPQNGNPSPTGYEITGEAQANYDERKRALEERIGQLAIEAANLKAEMKGNREAMAEETKELQRHILRGPEKMPLFDRPPQEPKDDARGAAENAEPPDLDHTLCDSATPQDNAPEVQPAEEPPEPWRAAKLADLPGLTEKIVEILEGHGLHTLGDWVDMPRLKGIEYTQLSGITEKRFEKIQAAMLAATCPS